MYAHAHKVTDNFTEMAATAKTYPFVLQQSGCYYTMVITNIALDWLKRPWRQASPFLNPTIDPHSIGDSRQPCRGHQTFLVKPRDRPDQKTQVSLLPWPYRVR